MSAKRNPIIADLRPHMDGLIQTRPDMLQRVSTHDELPLCVVLCVVETTSLAPNDCSARG